VLKSTQNVLSLSTHTTCVKFYTRCVILSSLFKGCVLFSTHHFI